MTSALFFTLCLSLFASSSAAVTPCNSEDGECAADLSVSLLQASYEVVKTDEKQAPVLAFQQGKKAALKAADQTDLVPMFTEESMPAVSTTNKCIIMLSLQYFALYTGLAIVRTLSSFKFNVAGIQKILETGCTTITYAPMLCVLFLGSRMRALQLAQNDTEKWQLPQPWVQTSMLVAAYAVAGQVVLVLLVGFVSGTSAVETDKEGNLVVSKMTDSNPLAVQVLTIIRYVIMFMLYGGTAAVVYGVFQMEGPKELWGEKQLPVSPAVMCTILLTTVFFSIYLVVSITNTCFELSPSLRDAPGLLKLEAAAASAKFTVNFAPMLCILFVGARMRALQIDPKEGHPQTWAQRCFFMCTFSVIIQAGLVIVLPFATGAECKRGSCEGDVAFVMESPVIGAVMTTVRYICLFALYGGVSAVVYSVYTIEHPSGPELTPPIAPALQCAIFLTTQYFLVYTMLFVCITVKSFVLDKGFQVTAVTAAVTKAIAIFDAGRATVMFAPMLCCLFFGARMRATQLAASADGSTPKDAGPQKWVQDSMFLATWAVMIQLCMTMLVTLLTCSGDAKPEFDEDNNVKVPADSGKYLAIFVELVRYANLVMMYLGATAVVAGILVMTPEEVQPYSVRGLFR